MLCYKGITFCDATDCKQFYCDRNRNGYNYTPDTFWEDKICIGNIKEKCDKYEREVKHEN